MAFDEALAGRIRQRLTRRKNAEEKKMFGGKGWVEEVHALRSGLWRSGRLPAGGQAPGTCDRVGGAERQRLRRGARQRFLEAAQGVNDQIAGLMRQFLRKHAARK